MAKYENIRALAKKQLQAVTESSDRWKAFLRTAAIAYNYSFPNQLLIHEQSPTATAVADIAYWNNNAGRWVKRGAHGIAVFDTRANSSRLRYLFDISDTIPRAEIPEALPWVITDQNWRPVWDKIVADNHADSIQSALLMLSTSCVAQRSAMFTTALGKAIDGSSLQWAKPDEQRQQFLQLITQSCLYMAALRCGVDTARLDLSALESVNQFDTNRIALCLGSACQQAARPLMQQIGSITREIDSVARAEKVRYYGDKQEETNNTKEVNNGVHDGERLPNPGADAERAADAGNRQVRQPAAEFSARERADGVRRDAAGGDAVPASGGDGQRSTPANRADDADADAAEHRPEPADRPDGLDAVDERLAEPSRGTGDAADLQPVIQEPQAESDTTPSAFSVPISDLPPLSDELILGLLAKESSSRADNAAILEYFNEHPDLAERSAFCKHCYKQIYTYLFVDDHTVGFIRHDMYLELWEGNYLTKTAQVNLTWDAVAAKIADLIEQGRLIVPIKAAPVQQQMEQLTLTPEDSEKAGLPSHEQQAKNIDLAAEAKKWNKPIIDASGKYISEQDITDALCKGGGFEDSKFRIQQYLSAQVLPIEEDQARWLKKEYGIGGGTWIFRDDGHGFLDHMGKNLEITRRTEDGEYRRVLKWKEVAQRLRLLVYNDQYLTDAEKAPYQAWAAEQQAARAANDAALDHAKHAITDFCENEGLNEPNFSDLTRVEFAYSTTEDDEHEIQVYANLLRNEIRYEVDGNIVHIDYFQDNHELAAQGIENSAFSDFINTAEAEFEKHHPTTRKVEKSPVTIGSTVYLEDARPFTVEEIGRENIHLRDESFPLVGRAVSHEEFARLLAANPKNAALSAPEVPSRQEQQGETAEPIVGEVIEEPKGCFDHISHEWLLENIPMDTQMLYKWLKCGFVDTKQLFPTEEGTPQGGTISPVLMNMTLDGLERTLKERFPTREYRNRKTHFTKVNFVRYADDFIITGESPELLQNEVLPLVRQFMAERGLQLSEEKTVITHIDEGFDFLGQNIRKYNGKLLIKPSKSSAKFFLKKIREIVKSNKGAPQDLLIRKLNPVIRGWVNYHRYVVSAETFSWIDYQIYKCLWQWATRRHRHKGRKWIAKKYWHYIGTRQWTFAAELKGDSTKAPYLALEYATNTNILRFKKIVAEANPFDERWNGYYEERDGEKMLNSTKGREKLLKLWCNQKHLCPVCNEPITSETSFKVHKIFENRTYRKSMMVHPLCHNKLHNSAVCSCESGFQEEALRKA